MAAGGSQIGQHDGERFADPQLAAAQFGHGGGVAGVAGQMEATQPLDGDNAPVAQQSAGGLQRVLAGGRFSCVARSLQPQARPTDGAGDGLGVEAPVEGVSVFSGTVGAEREAGHRCQRPVVGDVADDGEARAAVGAVDKRVAVAAVGRVEQLAQAVVADGHVGRDGLERARLGT